MNIKNSQRNFFSLLHNGNTASCLAYFTSLEHKPWLYRDIEGYSPLHYSIYDDNTSLACEIISLTKERLSKDNNAEFVQFINSQSKKGFTALHYAAMKGNITVTKTLLANGADYSLCNKAGANVLHIAAQYNRCNVIYYYIKTYYNDNNVYMVGDYKGNTLLHWACYCKCDSAVKMVLLFINGARNESDIINAQAQDGYTALHFAIENNSECITKRLLLRGANKHIPTKQNQTAYDLALQYTNSKLISLLRNKNYKKLNKSLCSVVFFYSIHFLIPICVLLFNSLYIDNDNIVILYIIWNCILFVFVYGNIIINPRELHNDKVNTAILLNALEDININEHCPICEVKCTETSNHCYVCNKCIDTFDHHCVWIGKCVGKGNVNWFYMSIVFVFVNVIIANAFVIYSEIYPHTKTTHTHIVRECILRYNSMLLTLINANNNVNINNTIIKPIITLIVTILGVFSLVVLFPILTECTYIYCKNKRRFTYIKGNNNNDIELITKPST